jgi:hypothetical protein
MAELVVVELVVVLVVLEVLLLLILPHMELEYREELALMAEIQLLHKFNLEERERFLSLEGLLGEAMLPQQLIVVVAVLQGMRVLLPTLEVLVVLVDLLMQLFHRLRLLMITVLALLELLVQLELEEMLVQLVAQVILK